MAASVRDVQNLVTTVVGLQGHPVSPAVPEVDDVLAWDGTVWAPVPLPSPGGPFLPLSGGTLIGPGDLNVAGTLDVGSNGVTISSGNISAAGFLYATQSIDTEGSFTSSVASNIAGPSFNGLRSRGTSTAPLAVQAGDQLMGMFGGGFYSAGNSSSGNVAIDFIADENWTATAQGTRIEFVTTPDGANSAKLAVVIGNDQSLTANGSVIINGGPPNLFLTAGSVEWGVSANSGGFGITDIVADATRLAIDGSGNVVISFGNLTAVGQISTDAGMAAGTFVYAGNVVQSGNISLQPGGGPWGDSSDARIKTVEGDYTQGLDAILTLKPHIYTFKGNDDAPGATRAGPHESVKGKRFIGLVAQEVEDLFPEMVTKTNGFIDGEEVDDMRVLNTGPLIYAFVNAIQELAARVTALEGQGP